tara:strand:- start:193 stop:1275 length:1083 start_codon:yes stop_codon:yes gene_type:complete
MSASIIIGIIAFLGFLAFIGYSIYNISSNTICDSSKCISPGGTWIKDKCTCSCNPGYSGVNCQTKSKNVSDLETACKDKTGTDCANCLKTNITKNLSGSGTDVQQFKDDFTSSITAINNICCSKNCSNTSGTACDNCVKTSQTDTAHIFDNKTYVINNKGCISYWTKNVNGGITQNNISKNILCNNNSGGSSPPPQSLPKCPISGGLVNKCEDVGNHSKYDFAHQWQICSGLASKDGYMCKVDNNNAATKCVKDTNKPCVHPSMENAKTLFNVEKCNYKGWPTNTKCQCPGMDNKFSINPLGYSTNVEYYTGKNCDNICDFNSTYQKDCPCGSSSPDCEPGSCSGDWHADDTDIPGRKCG